jgi:hypothetical protein
MQHHILFTFFLYMQENTLRLGYKICQLMMYKEIITICSQIHTRHTNTLCGQDVELLDVKPGSTYSDHWVLEC